MDTNHPIFSVNKETKKSIEDFNQSLRKLQSQHVELPYAVRGFDFPSIPRIPSPNEIHSFESSEMFIKRIATIINEYIKQIPENYQPSIIIFLPNGSAIQVNNLIAESHHGIRIEGEVDGIPCMIFTHQANLQLLFYIQEIKEDIKPRKIGFEFE